MSKEKSGQAAGDAEQTEEEITAQAAQNESDGEKKEGKVSGFFKKLGKKLDDATYTMRMHSEFTSSHPKYVVYGGTGILDATPQIAAEERLGEGCIVTIDESDMIKAGNLIKTPGGDVLHIAATESTKIDFDFEGKTNELAATKIILGEKATEVNVIKVDDKFYLA